VKIRCSEMHVTLDKVLERYVEKGLIVDGVGVWRRVDELRRGTGVEVRGPQWRIMCN